MTDTPRGAPELVPAQTTPESTVNRQIRHTEAGACHFPVADRTTSPPGSCSDGANYIITATATGAWTGKENQIATAVGTNAANGWYYHTPVEGFTAYVQDENARYLYGGSSWAIDTTGGGGGTAATLDFDTDGTLAANSDAKIATQKAVKTYVDTAVTGLLEWKGATDCSGNPNYPAASKGDAYTVSVAGKIGGASGSTVDVGDVFIATADNAGGTQASVGASWVILEHNLVAALSGSVASTTEQLTGTDNTKLSTPDSVAALWEQGSDVASSGTVSLGEGGYFNITGTTTITDIDFATDKAGRKAWVKFAGILTLTHNASTLILPTGANIATAAGDTACFVSEGSDAVRCVAYQRASGAALVGASATVPIQIACSDENTALTTGTAKVTFRMPFAGTLAGVRASLTTAQASGSIFTVDINEGGTSVLSTKLTIDNTEKTSTTAATPAVISDSALADDAEITIDIDQVGDGTAKGLKVTLLVVPA